MYIGATPQIFRASRSAAIAAKNPVGIAALEVFDQRKVFALDPLGHRLIGGKSVAKFSADVREIHSREHQHVALFGRYHRAQRFEKRTHARILRRHLSGQDHFVERAYENRDHLVAAHAHRIGQEQRLKFDRMLAAMQKLVGEQIAARVAACKLVHELAIGLDQSERRDIILACRAE